MTSAPTRHRRGRLILRMLDAAAGPAAEAWRRDRAALDALAAEALPWVIAKAVEMPMVHGLDVGPRIIYEQPPPYEHALEYLQAAANGYSFDDPRGWYEAEDAARPLDRIREYEAGVSALCRRWGLTEPWAARMIVHADLRAVAARDPAAGDSALDALAGTEGERADPTLEADVAAILARA
ncbi:MAG: hypothetical protein WD058_07560, partial [Dehalococcoidia bacterium]